jgi:lipoate-protein ligase A
VAGSLERQLGKFLRERRGEMTYAEFSRRLGLPPPTLHRLERGDQSITLRGLQQIMKRLRCTLSDIFGVELSQGRKQSSRSTIRDFSTHSTSLRAGLSLEMTRRLFAALEVCHDCTSHSAAMNMAIDEALIEVATIPSIRFYRWNCPALSFGYFGKFSDVADYSAERDLVRRWTGGGIVFHGDDLTYSIVIPTDDPIFRESSMSIYAAIHAALCNALNIDGQRAELAPVAGVVDAGTAIAGRGHDLQSCSHAAVARPTAHWSACDDGPQGRGYNPHLCFANPVSADVLVNGHKVAGAAQRRTRAGLLHQGSIQCVDLGNGLAERFANELSNAGSEKSLGKSLMERAEEIATQKYATQNWLRRQ